MENITLEQIITVSVLCIWFAFPMGMLISFMRQSNEQQYPKVKLGPEKKSLHKYPNHRNFGDNNYIEDDDIDDEYVDVEMPTIPAYQVPKQRNGVDQWKT